MCCSSPVAALRAGTDAQESLAISRSVSTAVIEVVRAALPARPAWVIAKGGITSHDVAVRGLGIRRATVLGQLLPGLVSVFRPIEAAAEAVGIPYVVFAGNVGDDNTLADVLDLFTAAADREPAGSKQLTATRLVTGAGAGRGNGQVQRFTGVLETDLSTSPVVDSFRIAQQGWRPMCALVVSALPCRIATADRDG